MGARRALWERGLPHQGSTVTLTNAFVQQH